MTLAEYFTLHDEALDHAYNEGDALRVLDIQVAGALQFGLVALGRGGFVWRGLLPEDPATRLSLLQHGLLEATVRTHIEGLDTVSDDDHLGYQAIKCALDLRLAMDGVEADQTWRDGQIALCGVAFGKAIALLRALQEGFFDRANSQVRSVDQGRANLAASRAAESWWWPFGEAKYRELQQVTPRLRKSAIDDEIVAYLRSIAGERKIPEIATITAHRLRVWR